MAGNNRVLVAGSANVDFVFRTHRFPIPGETLPATDFSIYPGGKGANQAVAAAKLGANVRFSGSVGVDPYSEVLVESLEGAGVDCRAVIYSKGSMTGSAGIFVNEEAQNQILVHAGANALLRPENIAEELDLRKDSPDVLLTQLESPLETVSFALKECNSRGIITILNPAPASELPESIFPYIDIITPNETEAERLTGIPAVDESSLIRIAESLRSFGVRAVCITLGERGVYFQSGNEAMRIQAIPVRAIDTTAAGDAFSGALAAFLASGIKNRLAVLSANQVAALSTTKRGAQPSMPSLIEFNTFAKTNGGTTR